MPFIKEPFWEGSDRSLPNWLPEGEGALAPPRFLLVLAGIGQIPAIFWPWSGQKWPIFKNRPIFDRFLVLFLSQKSTDF